MIVLGLLLVVLALVLGLGGLWLTASSTLPLALVAGPLAMELPATTLFVLGMVSIGLLWVGWLLLRTGTVHKVRAYRQRRQSERDRRDGERYAATSTTVSTDRAPGLDQGGDPGFGGSSGTGARTD